MNRPLTTFLFLLCTALAWSNGIAIDGIHYILYDNGTASVTYTGAESTDPNRYAGAVAIPEQIVYQGRKYRVTRIGEGAFRGCSALRSIHIPNSVVVIEEYGFYGSTALQSVHFGTGIQQIHAFAFAGCTAITSVIIPKGLKRIGQSAFSDCRQLSKLSLGDSLQVIGESAFATCSELRTVTFPKNLVRIGAHAFRNCIHLENIILPENLREMGEGAFRSCTNLNSIYMGGNLQVIPNMAFAECYDLSSIAIGRYVAKIGDAAFKNCTNLKSIHLPQRINEIGNTAFAQCRSLHTVTIGGCTPPKMGTNVFEGVKQDLQINLLCANSQQSFAAAKGWSAIGSIRQAEQPTQVNDTDFAQNGSTDPTPSSDPTSSHHTLSNVRQEDTPSSFTLTVKSQNENHGLVAGGGTFTSGTKTSVLAAARKGYRFLRWSDNETAEARDIVLTQDSSLTAVFEKVNNPNTPIAPSVATNNPAWGKVYIQLWARPENGHSFLQWQDGSTDNPRLIKKQDAETYVATFSEKPTETTKSDSVHHKSHKVHQDGNLYIMRNGKMYNILGVSVENEKK